VLCACETTLVGARRMALAAYRNLLRSARIAFQGKFFNTGGNTRVNALLTDVPLLDDIRLLHAARQQAQAIFRSNASLPPNDPKVALGIERAEEVAKILRENIVQGRHIGNDKYSMFFKGYPSL
jgi:complex III assembly factor LYRM7